MRYLYTAVFTPIEDGSGYYARVPDLPGCVTTGRDLTDAVDMITDAAGVWLVVAEDHNDPISPPTDQWNIPRPDNSVVTLVSVDTLAYRAATDARALREALPTRLGA